MASRFAWAKGDVQEEERRELTRAEKSFLKEIGDEPHEQGKPRKPDTISLYVYCTDQEPRAVPLGSRKQWERFARWAAEQDGELARLATEGHTDAYRTQEAIAALRKQLADASPPGEHAPTANAIAEAIAGENVDGVFVSLADDADNQE